MKQLQKLYPHAIILLGFVLISLIYFYPVLQGKQISQSDIEQYTGMAKEQNDFRKAENVEPYWTNSAFGGMPTYQLGAKYPHALILLGFVLISLIYFYPVLQGKQISQSDIVQYTGMAKEQNDFRKA